MRTLQFFSSVTATFAITFRVGGGVQLHLNDEKYCTVEAPMSNKRNVFQE